MECMNMDSLKNATIIPKGGITHYAKEMAQFVSNHLAKITEFIDLPAETSPQAQTETDVIQPPLTLHFEATLLFPDLLSQWHTVLVSLKKDQLIDISQVNLSKLALSFNEYVSFLAKECDSKNVWNHNDSLTACNQFTPYYHGDGELELGHAFVGHYKESTVLRRLFILDPSTLNISRFAPYEKPCFAYTHAHPESAWAKIENLLTLGQDIINTLKILEKIQKSAVDEAIREQCKRIHSLIAAFQQAENQVQLLLAKPDVLTMNTNEQSPHFYHIDDVTLSQMNESQLVTICLEELNSDVPSPLIEKIISNDELWNRIEQVFNKNELNNRTDSPQTKIATIHQWRKLALISEQRHNEHIKNLGIDILKQELALQKLEQSKLEQLEKTISLSQINSTTEILNNGLDIREQVAAARISSA